MLLEGLPLTGSQNTVLYRADVVRARRPFYPPDRHFADCDTAIEILLEHDLGFVHQVLSFTRTENDSLWAQSQAFSPLLLNQLLALEQFGERVLAADELARARAGARSEYFRALGRHAVRRPGRAFWEYHRRGLALLGWKLDWLEVAPWTVAELLRIVLNPENTLRRVARKLRKHPGPALSPPRKS
jgi:hypothetical protein